MHESLPEQETGTTGVIISDPQSVLYQVFMNILTHMCLNIFRVGIPLL